MAALNFPNNPQIGDFYSANNRVWKWSGSTWQAQGITGYTGSQGAPSGYTGSASTEPGPTGSRGLIGYTGSQGAGFTGSKGDLGYTGSGFINGQSITVDIINFADSTQMNSGANTSTKNRFINGAMAVDQRNNGASQSFTPSSSLVYTVDRWYAYCTGAIVTGQRVAGSITSSQYNYQFTGATNVNSILFAQRIEQLNSYDLAGKTTTVSVNLSNSLLTTVTWTAYYANSADTFGSIAIPTKTQIATGSWTVTSTLSRYSANISIPSAATTGIEIVFSVGAQISGTWVIGSAQFELSTVATAFERRIYTQELINCQRYCFRPPFGPTGNSNNWLASAGAWTSATFAFASGSYPVTMRNTPILTLDGAVSNYAIYSPNGGAYSAATGIALNPVSNPSIFLLNINTASGGTAGQVAYLSLNSQSTIGLFFSAEL
jgi:hypothetical protein